MGIKRNSFDGGTDGVTISVGNNGGASGDTVTTVNLVGGGTAVYDNAQTSHGGLSALITPTAANAAQLIYDFAATDKKGQASTYFRTPSLFTSDARIFAMRASGGYPVSIVLKSGTNFVEVTNYANTPLLTSTVALAVNTWYRLELYSEIDATAPSTTNGIARCAVYAGDSLTTLLNYNSGPTINAGLNDVQGCRKGRLAGAADTTGTWWDSLQMFSGVDAIGLGKPWAPSKVPFVPTRISNTEIEVAWTHPGDAPSGLSLIRWPAGGGSPETDFLDGASRDPSDPLYDPTTRGDTTTVASGLDGTDTPYSDTGLTPGDYFHTLVRD